MPATGKYGLPIPEQDGEPRPTVSLRILQAEQAAAGQLPTPRNEEALAVLRGEQPIPTAPPAAYAAPPPATETTADIIARMRLRRAQIVAETMRLEGLRAELVMIDKMIAATEVPHG